LTPKIVTVTLSPMISDSLIRRVRISIVNVLVY
jgi:hypothetical protein